MSIPPLAIDPSYSKVIDDAVDVIIFPPPVNQALVKMYFADPHKGRATFDLHTVVGEAIQLHKERQDERPTSHYGFSDKQPEHGIECTVTFDLIGTKWVLSPTILPTFTYVHIQVIRCSYVTCENDPRFSDLYTIMLDYYNSTAPPPPPWLLWNVYEARYSKEKDIVLHVNTKYTKGGFVVAQLNALFTDAALQHLQRHQTAGGGVFSWDLLTDINPRTNVVTGGITTSDVQFSPALRDLRAFINLSQLILCVKNIPSTTLWSNNQISSYHRIVTKRKECPSQIEAIQLLCCLTNTRKVICNIPVDGVSFLLNAGPTFTSYEIEGKTIVDCASNQCTLPGVLRPIPITGTYAHPELVITLYPTSGTRTATWASTPSTPVPPSYLLVHFIVTPHHHKPKTTGTECYYPTDCTDAGCSYDHDNCRVLFVVHKNTE
eukprot:PhF_6_TR34821/c0_g2_i1/m.50596